MLLVQGPNPESGEPEVHGPNNSDFRGIFGPEPETQSTTYFYNIYYTIL